MTGGALMAPMSEHPTMPLERVKNTPVNQVLGRSRGGFGSKIHLVTDGHGLPLGFCLSPGQSAEIKYATSALAMARIPTSSALYRTRPTHLAADKVYSSRAFRAELRLRRIKAVIQQRSDQRRHHKGRPLILDKVRYRWRNVVERCFGWLKKFRRFSTGDEKLAGSFAAFSSWLSAFVTCGNYWRTENQHFENTAWPVVCHAVRGKGYSLAPFLFGGRMQ